jgi:hypothetical protein
MATVRLRAVGFEAANVRVPLLRRSEMVGVGLVMLSRMMMRPRLCKEECWEGGARSTCKD